MYREYICDIYIYQMQQYDVCTENIYMIYISYATIYMEILKIGAWENEIINWQSCRTISNDA